MQSMSDLAVIEWPSVLGMAVSDSGVAGLGSFVKFSSIFEWFLLLKLQELNWKDHVDHWWSPNLTDEFPVSLLFVSYPNC